MTLAITIIGGLLALAGPTTEAVAIVAMGWWALRRKLPHVFAVQSLGFVLWLAGAAILVLGRTMLDSR